MKTSGIFLQMLCLSIFLHFSCKQEKTKKVEKALGNGETEIFYVLKSDTNQKEGLYYRVNSKGDTLEKSQYTEGKIEGQRILYYPDGQVNIVENYIHNTYNGPYQSFFENGAPKQFGTFKDGQFEGELKTYYKEPAGRLKETIFLTNGVEDGAYKQYYPDGKIQTEGIYTNGLKEGEFKEYHPNGALSAEGKYLDDIEDGEIKIYDTTGTLIKIYVFKDKRPVETIKIR